MDVWLEILKVGGPVVCFAIVLLWATIQANSRMADELNKDKDRLLTALGNMSTVVANNTMVMESVKKAIDKCEKAQQA